MSELVNWDYPEPFTNEIIVQAKDIDGLGHSNNASYVIWCEQCAWKHSEFLGLSVTDYQRLDRAVAIRKADYDYYLPSFEDEKLVVATWITDCDRRLRLERHFQIINPENGNTILRGHWQVISVVISTGKATRMPAEFVDCYGAAVVACSAIEN